MDHASGRTPPVLRHLDTASAALLLALTVWAPWAFGATTYETILVMNWAGAALGALLLAKQLVRWRTGHAPARWAEPTPAGRWAVRALAVLTVLVLAHVLAGALNARATAEHTKLGVDLQYLPREPIPWLPASYDRSRSLPSFWRWAALAVTFWAARDWFLGKSRRERRLEVGGEGEAEAMSPPERVRVWLWTLALSSTVLALVCLLQRLDGTEKLLWIKVPAGPAKADFRYGPYSYRSSAAQYFNLVWPLALGLWWSLGQAAKRRGDARLGGSAHVLLLPCVLLLAASPILSTSRGGALVMGVLTIGVLAVLLSARGAGRLGARLVLVGTFAAVLAFGLALGGRALTGRFAQTALDPLNGRAEIYETAHRMAADFTWLGSGAGTFMSLYALYRARPEDPWQAYAHNDWLEARITLGRVGFGLLVAMLALVPLIVRGSRGQGVPREFAALLVLAAGGAGVHAAFDMPFQVHSVLFQFLMTLAVASTLGRRTSV